MHQHLGRPGIHGAATPLQPVAVHLQSQPHIGQGGEIGQQVVGLEDETGLTPQLGEHRALGMQQLHAQDLETAALGCPQAPQHGEQGGFARAGGALEDHDFTGVHRQVDVMQHLLGHASFQEGMVEMLHLD